MLPDNYLLKIQEILKEEFQNYLTSFKDKPFKGMRINTNKISVEDFLKLNLAKLEPIEWSDDGFYYEDDSLTKHPYYYAGLYYFQEPSAMLPAMSLPIEENDIVLDLCAAPGGKSLKLLNKLNNTGLLIANDISVSRAQALLRNIERQGYKNFFVTAEDGNKLKEKYPQTFTKILIDAPCSGQGMFRKDPSLIKAYQEKDSSYYVPIQKSLIDAGVAMLKEGGMLLYSTCTFAKEEDEEIIEYALDKYPDLKQLDLKLYPGFKRGDNNIGLKLFPHLVKGEGHFVCLLQKGENKIINKPIISNYKTINNKQYLVPDFNTDGIHVLRSGLYLGERDKPSQALAHSLKINEYDKVIELDINQAEHYLKGETLKINSNLKGLVLVCLNDFPIGFGKIENGIMKNKIDKGWIKR